MLKYCFVVCFLTLVLFLFGSLIFLVSLPSHLYCSYLPLNLSPSSVSPNGSISVTPLLLNSFNGDSVQFTCTAQGGPGNEFAWRYLRTGETVSTTQQMNLTSDESVGGQYQCEVFNLAGNGTASATLNG